jgi:hypothetical protein
MDGILELPDKLDGIIWHHRIVVEVNLVVDRAAT